jgi:hypothetical protein
MVNVSRCHASREWRQLRNKELHNSFSSPNIVRLIKSQGMRLVRRIARFLQAIYAYKIMVRKSERKIQLRRWEGNIHMNSASIATRLRTGRR